MAYNERDWLKSSISNEFSILLEYQENGGNQWNGNISRQYWSQDRFPASSPNKFSYGYDPLNRLNNGASTGVYMSEVRNYDNMGNISQLSRNGGPMNQYYYNGNRLDRMDNVAGQYIYDDNGNAKTDGRTGMQMSYNLLNLSSGASGNGKVLSYVYDADGSKLRKVVTENGSTTSREYIDGIEYDGNNIDVIHTEEGVAQRNGDNSYSYHYNLTDHLGNVRYTFDIYNNQIRPLQVDNYYPFGMRKTLASGNNKYLYNGKEAQDELGGQLDYGARFYDPVIGRWNVLDPLAEKCRRFSPYVYANNNPVRFIDPDGMEAEDPKTHKDVTNSFKYDNKSKTTGTDYVTSTSTTYYNNTNDDGSVTQSSYTVSLTATVDRDGNIGKEVSQNITTTTETRGKDADGNPIIVTGSYKTNSYESKLDYKSVVDRDLKAGASSVASIKKETGLSPLQNRANYQNNVGDTYAKVTSAGGLGGAAFSKLSSGPITAVVGAIFTLSPKSDPEKLFHTVKIK